MAAAGACSAESLADAIALAYKTNPNILGQRAVLGATNETFVQARDGYRPQVSAQAVGTRQDYQQLTSNTVSALITATQPIYTGGRTASAVSAAEADVLSGRETLRQTESALLSQVIQAYADVIRDQEAVAIHQANLDALSDQLKETAARAKQGDLTRTDVSQTQGYVFQAKVDLTSAQAQLDASRAEYAAVVGQAPGALEPPPTLPNLPANLDQALATGELGNPQVRASQYAEQAARLRTAEARDQRLPNVTFEMQYGYYGPQSPYTPNIYPKDTVATVTVTQPLFAGGTINSQVRQQIQHEAAARDQTEAYRRTMVQQIAQAWSAWRANSQNASTADDEVKANAVAYEGVQKEHRADLRSTLEVLYIEQSLREAELERSSARHDAYVSAANLLAAMGLLQAELLVPGVNLYDPAKAFDRVRWAGAVPWEILPSTLDHLTSPALKRLPPPPSQPVSPAGP
ncbi:MAG TPA: TolC family outer membrane protein [Caulobacteraceae bacterium]|nr:TolC family outer membrane protein [Caulobacteraceae bacterium]